MKSNVAAQYDLLDSRIYGQRRANDEMFILLLTNTGHFLIVELGDYDYRIITANNWPNPRRITVSFVPITAGLPQTRR